MKKNLTRFMATALSVAMVAANPLTVLATESGVENGDPITANILAYSVDRYVVPTTVNLALNPQNLNVTTRAALQVEGMDSPETDDDRYLAAVTDNSQIVSLEYGVANLSSTPKNLDITITVDGWQNSGITFVSPESQKNNNENWISLSVTGASNYQYIDNGVIECNDSVVTKVVPDFVDNEGTENDYWTYGVEEFDITDRATLGDALSDIKISPVARAFDRYCAAGDFTRKDVVEDGVVTSSTISATCSYKLYDADYNVTVGAIDFDTTQAQIQNSLQLRELGGIAGFTFEGQMNSLVDWARDVNVDALTFTPVYRFTDAELTPEDLTPAPEYQYVAVDSFYDTNYSAYYVYTDIVDLTSDDIAEVTVNGELVAFSVEGGNRGIVAITRRNIINALGEDYATANELVLEVTIDGTKYYAEEVPHN